MRVIVCAVFGTLAPAACATTFHVDAVKGHDSYRGTDAEAPWQTITKVNAFGAEIGYRPGDVILFRRGCVWRETLMIFDFRQGRFSSGVKDNPIRFGAYGEGDRPVISGANPVTNWTLHAPNCWKAPAPFVATPAMPIPDLVFFDGDRGARKDTLAGLANPKDWRWEEGFLYTWSPTDPAAAYPAFGVEIALRDYCVWGAYNAHADYVVFEDFELRNAGHKNLVVELDDDYWTIRRVYSHHNGALGGNDKNGLYFAACAGHLVAECTLAQAAGNNINFLQCSDVVLERCTSFDANHHCIDMKGGFAGGLARNNLIRYNTVYLSPEFAGPTAVTGIFLGLGNNPPLSDTRVHNNLVYNMTANGIHVDTFASGIEIANNVVADCGRVACYVNTDSPVTVRNNIAVAKPEGLAFGLVSGFANKVVDYNCWYAAGRIAEVANPPTPCKVYASWDEYQADTPYDRHSVCGDPAFVDPGRYDFRLSPQSACIDRGVGAGLTADFAGTPVPQGAAPDIGAYETAPPAGQSPSATEEK